MTISHHPDPSTLMSFAAGTLAEPLSAVVASHVAMCPRCRREMVWLEEAGGVLLGSVSVTTSTDRPLPTPPLHSIKERTPAVAAHARGDVPAPLARLIGPHLGGIGWTWLAPGIWHKPLPLSKRSKGDLRLIKVSPGLQMPEHGHGGQEMTLLLQGAYDDRMGRFEIGDIADLDEGVEHQPVADAKAGCVCLIASEKPARYKGWLPRLLQPLIGL